MTANTFWQRGYHLIDGLLTPEQLLMTQKAMDLTRENGGLIDQPGTLATDALGSYSPVMGQMLLRHCQTRIEDIIGRDLIVNYAYWRLYLEGSALKAHKDRAGCEITVTITIEPGPGAQDWPIMVTDLEGETSAFVIPPGGGLLFRSDVCEHWREPLIGPWQKQLFLHYVLKDGEYADHAFDQLRAYPEAQDAG